MIGTDPEFFIRDTAGKPVPAWRFFPPKEQKVTVQAQNYDHVTGSYFRDGYALELNNNAETCRGRFGNKLYAALAAAKSKLPTGYTLSAEAAVKIDLFDAMTDVPPDGQVFGCDPSYNAYDAKEHSVDLDALEHEYRYAGGHLHYSGENNRAGTFMESNESKFMFIKLCDILVGLPLAYLFDSEDEVRRRQFYGKAGECRLQNYGNGSHGVEYRTPSPRVFNTYKLASMFFGVMRQIVCNYKELANTYDSKWEKPVQRAINTCQVKYSMLQRVSGFYTPELLKDLKTRPEFMQFNFVNEAPNLNADHHTAFTEWCTKTYGPMRHLDVESRMYVRTPGITVGSMLYLDNQGPSGKTQLTSVLA